MLLDIGGSIGSASGSKSVLLRTPSPHRSSRAVQPDNYSGTLAPALTSGLLPTLHGKSLFWRFYVDMLIPAESRGCRPGMYSETQIREDFQNFELAYLPGTFKP